MISENNILVSVIITTYNRSNLLCRAIDSVKNQTYKALEIIVVDDASSDDTYQNFKNKYFHDVKYIRNKNNVGLSAARNIGIKAASGGYISFLDDDDELMAEKIEKQIELFKQKSDIDVVYCGSIRRYKDVEIENRPECRGNIYKNALRACPNAIHSLLIKKNCLDKIGYFDETLDAFEDWDMWIRLSRHYHFDFVSEALVVYNFHGHQMSAELGRKIKASKKILKKHFSELNKTKQILHWHYRKLVSRCSLAGKYRESLKYTRRAIYTNPLSLATYIHLLLLLTCPPLQRKLIYRYGLLKIGDIYIV